MSTKRKRRQLFGTVLAFAAMAASGGWINPASAPWLFAASMVYSGANAAYETRLAKKKAAEANVPAEDRRTMVRGGMVPKNYVYGTAWVSGVVVFVREARGRLPEPNPENKMDPWLYLVVAMPIAHPITKLHQVFFGDDPVFLDTAGWATPASAFAKNGSGSNTISGIVPANRLVVAPPKSEDTADINGNEMSIRISPATLRCSITTTVTSTTMVSGTPPGGGGGSGDNGGTHADDWWRDPAQSAYVPPNPNIYYPSTGDNPGGWGADPSYGAPLTQTYSADDPFDHRNSGMNAGESSPYVPYTSTYTVVLHDQTARLVPGTTNTIELPGKPGDAFTLTYGYVYTKSYMQVILYYGDGRPVGPHQELIAQTAYSSSIPKWTSQSHLRGIPYIVVKMRVDPDIFPREVENISFLIDGKAVFNPVNGTTAFSQNSMLIARDYAINECGVAATDLNLTDFIANVKVCDEEIPSPMSATNYVPRFNPPAPIAGQPAPPKPQPHEFRYTFNGVLSTEAEPINNLGAILASCDGTAVFSGATLDLRAGWFEEPVLVITDDDWASAPEIMVTPPRQEVINGIRSRFVNREKQFWPTDDAPAWISDYYKMLDGGVTHIREIDLSVGVIYPLTAQRLQKQMLHRARASLRIRGNLKVRALQLSPEQTVRVIMRSTGMSNKTFRIKALRPIAPHIVEVELQEDSALLYDWKYQEGQIWEDLTPNTTLKSIRDVPLINPRAETNQHVAVFGVGGQLQGRCRVYWAPVTDTNVLNGGYIEVQYKTDTDIRWETSGRLPPTTRQFFFPVAYGDVLLIQVRACNSLVKGRWSPENFLVHKALDVPTHYLAGNLLPNASFAPNMDFWLGNPEVGVDYDSILRWWGPIITTLNGRPYLPFQIVSEGIYGAPPGNADPLESGLYTGFLTWVDPEVATFGWAMSDVFPVRAGDRMVMYVYAWSQFSFLRMDIRFFNNKNIQVGTAMSGTHETFTRYPMNFLQDDFYNLPKSMAEFVLISHFFKVPEGAVSARAELISYVGPGAPAYTHLPAGEAVMPIFFRPFVGRASINQVQLPPWEST